MHERHLKKCVCMCVCVHLFVPLMCARWFDLPAADPYHLIPYLFPTVGLAKNFHSTFWGRKWKTGNGGSNSHWPPLDSLEPLNVQITKSFLQGPFSVSPWGAYSLALPLSGAPRPRSVMTSAPLTPTLQEEVGGGEAPPSVV